MVDSSCCRPPSPATQVDTMERPSQHRHGIDHCPECSSRIVQRTTSEPRCRECGLLVSERSQRNPSVARSISGRGPPQRPEHRLSTYIGDCSRDSRRRRISRSKRRRLRRQRRWQRRIASDAIGDSRRVGIAEIERLSGDLEVGNRVETVAATIFRRAVEERLLYGRACESVAAATVYLAVRRSGVHRRLDEIATESAESRRRLTRDARHLQRELGLAVHPPTAEAYLPEVCSELGLNECEQRRARRLLEAAIDENLHSGRDPSGLAASACYTVSRLQDESSCSQTAAAAAGDVCPETIRRRYRELRELCPDVFEDAPIDGRPEPAQQAHSVT